MQLKNKLQMIFFNEMERHFHWMFYKKSVELVLIIDDIDINKKKTTQGTVSTSTVVLNKKN